MSSPRAEVDEFGRDISRKETHTPDQDDENLDRNVEGRPLDDNYSRKRARSPAPGPRSRSRTPPGRDDRRSYGRQAERDYPGGSYDRYDSYRGRETDRGRDYDRGRDVDGRQGSGYQDSYRRQEYNSRPRRSISPPRHYNDYNGQSYRGSSGPMRGSNGPVTDIYERSEPIGESQFGSWLVEKREQEGPADASEKTAALTDEEIKTEYERYKIKHTALKKLDTFNGLKNNEWFRQKYHPVECERILVEAAKSKIEVQKEYFEYLDSDKFNELSYDQTSGNNNNEELTRPEYLGEVSKDYPVLHFGAIRISISRDELESKLGVAPGYDRLVLSDPKSERTSMRQGWLILKKGTDPKEAQKALEDLEIDGFRMHSIIYAPAPQKCRTVTSLFKSDDRLATDIKQLTILISTLDKEVLTNLKDEEAIKDFNQSSLTKIDEKLDSDILPKLRETETENLLKGDGANKDIDANGDERDNKKVKKDESDEASSETKELTDSQKAQLENIISRKRVDLYIKYLRMVHFYDYYTGFEYLFSEDFQRNVPIYLRRRNDANPSTKDLERTDARYNLRISSIYIPDRNDFIAQVIHAAGEESHLLTDEEINNRANDLKSKYDEEDLKRFQYLVENGGQTISSFDELQFARLISRKSVAKYSCKECGKLFKGDAFVRKHIRSKHPEILETIDEGQVLYFNRYIRDINAANATLNTEGPAIGPFTTSSFNPNASSSYGYTGDGGYGGYGPSYGRGPRGGGRGYGGPPPYRGRGGYSAGPPPPPPNDAVQDPRALNRYDDLDQVEFSGDMDISYD